MALLPFLNLPLKLTNALGRRRRPLEACLEADERARSCRRRRRLLKAGLEDDKRAQAIALLRTSGDVGFLIGASSMGALADWAGSLEMAMQSSSAILLTATGWFTARSLLTAQLAKSSSP